LFYTYFTQAAQHLQEGARALSRLVAVPAERPATAEKLRDVEHANDELTHALLRHLNSTFITPFDRSDIYALAARMDDVVDFMEAAADLVVLYQLDELPADVGAQVEVLVRAAELTAEAMPRLRSMRDLAGYWIEINRLENEADQVYRRLLAHLFSGAYDALTVLKLKEVVDQLEAAADAFEHAANTVESIAVKES
jgi:predicted phosphate transport protein (TIGR00153 family)